MLSYDQLNTRLQETMDKLASFSRALTFSEDVTEDDFKYYGGILDGQDEGQSWAQYSDLYNSKKSELTLQKQVALTKLEMILITLDQQDDLIIPDPLDLPQTFLQSSHRPKTQVTDFLSQIQDASIGYGNDVEMLADTGNLNYQEVLAAEDNIEVNNKTESISDLYESLEKASKENRPALLKKIMMLAVHHAIQYTEAEFDAMRLETDYIKEKYAGDFGSALTKQNKKDIYEQVKPNASIIRKTVKEAEKLLEKAKPEIFLGNSNPSNNMVTLRKN